MALEVEVETDLLIERLKVDANGGSADPEQKPDRGQRTAAIQEANPAGRRTAGTGAEIEQKQEHALWPRQEYKNNCSKCNSRNRRRLAGGAGAINHGCSTRCCYHLRLSACSYAFAANPKLTEIGRITYFAGLSRSHSGAAMAKLLGP
jgi:hypothetical protein